MSDDSSAESKPKSTRVKAILGTVAGLLSGAFMMYVSPLINKVVAPAKPIANFGVERDDLTVTFYNQSSGSGEGWFDFGDGSPLEPVSSKQMTVMHTYPGPDTYMAKLTWRNLLGDENERTVKIELSKPKTEPPAILTLEANPLCGNAFAPATFRVTSKLKNAKLAVWDCGDDRPLMFGADMEQDRLVTFPKAGGYMIKLAAVNGEEGVEKSTIVFVDEPPPGSLVAVVQVTDQGTRVDKLETPVSVSANFPPHQKDDVFRFDRQVPARQGYEITEARMERVNEQGVRNLDLKVSADRKTVHVAGEMVKEGGLLKINSAAPSLLVRVYLTQQRQVAETRGPIPVTGTVSCPGNVTLCLPPFPSTWVQPQRQIEILLRDGEQVVWQGPQLPRNAPITLRGRPHVLTATPLSGQVRLEIKEAPSPVASSRQ